MATKRIFVTVGTQLPFDRLIQAVSDWIGDSKDVEVFAQIGDSKIAPPNMTCKKFIDLTEYHDKVEWCDLLVGHAGMGAILTSLETGKPLVIMPRLASLLEARNDHQLATAKRFAEMGRVKVAMEGTELIQMLGQHYAAEQSVNTIGSVASDELIKAVREFLSS
jgi:UDP-N-acetylglucosamine transferase subunit ALG13